MSPTTTAPLRAREEIPSRRRLGRSASRRCIAPPSHTSEVCSVVAPCAARVSTARLGPGTPSRALIAAALLLLPSAARSESTAGCHCFRDRSFEPARPGAADAYILATTRSSLLSAAYGVGKGELVRAVMTGTAPEDLWISFWAAGAARREAGGLLEARAKKGSWREALAGVELGERFGAALARGAADAELAAIAVDDVLVRRAKADPASLRAIRSAGASTEETVVATVLSGKLGAPVLPLVAEVKAGRRTWGSVLNDAGIEPKQLDGLVRAMVR